MTVKEAFAYLNNIAAKTPGSAPRKRTEHDEIRRILEKFGSPQERLKIIHIAGTNGKTAACVFLSSALLKAGFRVGTFTSPHLERYTERITIDGKEIEPQTFAALLQRVLTAACGLQLSFFEILTIMAFVYFAENSVDYAVIETGIGGLLDVTNVTAAPLLSVITYISYDHTEILGGTIEEIAAQKAGIIKKNRPVVLFENEQAVIDIVQKTAKEKNAPLYYEPPDITIDYSDLVMGSKFSAATSFYTYEDLQNKLFGNFQVRNAANALLAVRALQDCGLNIKKADIYEGFRHARCPGRAEVMRQKPLVIIDGAHNPSGAAAFAEVIATLAEKRRIILVAAVKSTKPAVQVLKILTRRVNYCIITTVPGLGEPVTGCELNCKTVVIADYKQAIDHALSEAKHGDCVCIAGSLYLAGASRGYLLR